MLQLPPATRENDLPPLTLHAGDEAATLNNGGPPLLFTVRKPDGGRIPHRSDAHSPTPKSSSRHAA
jgi:hypothetical protein